MERREFLQTTVLGAAGFTLAGGMPGSQASWAQASAAQPSPAQASAAATGARSVWLESVQRVTEPVLRAGSQARLQAEMPVEAAQGHVEDRRRVTHLEAVGRTLSGIAPWLEHGAAEGSEAELRSRYAGWARMTVAHCVDPRSPGWLRFGEDRQTIVDAGFLSLALLRAPKALLEPLSEPTRAQLADALRATRHLSPPFNNWLLFAAATEAALALLGREWDRERVDYALREHASWYLGDGVYGDGPHFHADYYNSFVIHPFLLAVLDAVGEKDPEWRAMAGAVRDRATRYAAIQERTIAPDGSFPPIGRSLAYRCGAFHLLADAAYRQMLPEGIPPEQVRCALHATIRRTLDAPGTFDQHGWLRIGLCGHQPSIGETYISTGSLYLCANAFLPLGLAATDRFWTAGEVPWSSQKAWSGQDVPADHAISD